MRHSEQSNMRARRLDVALPAVVCKGAPVNVTYPDTAGDIRDAIYPAPGLFPINQASFVY
jgi:hypothetical protein